MPKHTSLHFSLLLALLTAASVRTSANAGDDITFDIPAAIECRDVTSKEFAAANPQLKQIEAKIRISAREIQGEPSEIVQLDYEVRIGSAMRVIDYSPKTTLESSVVSDQIEVSAADEKSQGTTAEAFVSYKPALFGGSHNSAAKTSEAKHFKQLAAKDVVLAAGTVDREHGVFFRLRPSRSAAFEGSREFELTAAVPQAWRADICQISCTARVTKRSMMSTSVVSVGGPAISVGIFLAGDAEAASAAEKLQRVEDQYHQVLAEHEHRSKLFVAVSRGASSLFVHGTAQPKRVSVDEAAKSLHAIQDKLKVLSATPSYAE